jgi:hypothetical protein
MSLRARRGWMRLGSVPAPDQAVNLWPVPNLVLQKLPAPQFTVTTKLDVGALAVGEKAGLLMMGMDYSFLAVERTASGRRLVTVSCKNANDGGQEVAEGQAGFAGQTVYLRVDVGRGAVCRFSFSRQGKQFIPVGGPFVARPGRWIGAKVGLFCLAKGGAQPSGHVDVDWFRFQPNDR